MIKELCFTINEKNLYLEHVLVEYMDIPIFFLCKDEKDYYIVLCTEIEELNYIVVKVSQADVYNLLHGNIAMRDVILKQNKYWDIISGDEIYLDKIEKKDIDSIDRDLLPEEGACFKSLTNATDSYIKNFDDNYLNSMFFDKSSIANSYEEAEFVYNDLEKIELSKKLLSLKLQNIYIENQIELSRTLYNASMQSLKKIQVDFEEDEKFKKSDFFVVKNTLKSVDMIPADAA